MERYDVVVVGGGPAGAICAKYLARNNLKTLLLQRNFSFKKPCGGGIRYDAFERFDIDEAVIAHKLEAIKLQYKEDAVVVDIAKNPLAIVERVVFDAALRNDAKEAGAELLEATFVDFRRMDDGFVVTLVQQNLHVSVWTKKIVAADGVHSKLRKKAGLAPIEAALAQYVDVACESGGECVFYFGKDVAANLYAWRFPYREGCDVGTLAPTQMGALAQLLRFLKIDSTQKMLGYKIPHYKKTPLHKDGIFFVGDSAAMVLPFTYEGIYYAMDGAKILAGVLASGGDGAAYEAAWSAKYEAKFATLLRLQRLFLYNNLTIALMMRLLKHPKFSQKMVSLWREERAVRIDLRFFLKLFSLLRLKA